ncbi:MAG: hypothetical protein ABJA62_04465 [Luteimonas sp.]
MSRLSLPFIATVALLVCGAGFSPAQAATAAAIPAKTTVVHCHDAKGRFAKCPTTSAKVKTCRDAKGHFAKCPT